MSPEGKLVVVCGVAFDATADPLWTEAETIFASRQDAAMFRMVHVVGRNAVKEETNEASLVDATLARLHAWVLDKAGSQDAAIGMHIHLEVAIGDPAEEIVQVAVDNSADLLLLGTHGRKGLSKLVLGSVAENVLHHAPCSVLIARPTDYAERDKSPTIEPTPEQGHRPFRPHPPRYHSSVVFSSYDANLFPTGVSRQTVR
jgi:nucleotide-binding universal stress UspA family protein